MRRFRPNGIGALCFATIVGLASCSDAPFQPSDGTKRTPTSVSLASLSPESFELVVIASGHDIMAMEISDSGHVAGQVPASLWQAALWMPPTYSLQTPLEGAHVSAAYSVNSHGAIVGEMKFEPGLPEAYYWSQQSGLVILAPLGTGGEHGGNWATDINDAGVIVGSSTPSPGAVFSRAVRWPSSSSAPQAIDPYGHGAALGIASDGTIVGFSRDLNTDLNDAWVYRNGVVTVLPKTPGTHASAQAANSLGQIVGTIAFKAVLWQPDGTIVHLGTLGGTNSTPTGINDDGVVVGYSATSTGNTHAFVWTGASGMFSLTPNAPWSRATGINKAGDISGEYEDSGGSLVAAVWTRKPCELFDTPPPYDWLERPDAASILLDIGLASNWHQPLANRFEIGGWIVEKGGELQFVEWQYKAPLNWCQNAYPEAQYEQVITDTTHTVIAEIHSHPVTQPGAFDVTGIPCYTWFIVNGHVLGPVPQVGSVDVSGGPSDIDLLAWQVHEITDFPGMVISPDSLWAWETPSTPGDPPPVVSVAFKKDGNSCF